MSAVLIAAPLIIAVVALPSLVRWTGRYFEATILPTALDEGR